MLVKKSKILIKRILKPLANKLGFVLKSDVKPIIKKESQKNILLHDFYGAIKKLGFEPKHIIDVGANHGTWTREVLKFFPESKITMFEPQEKMKDSIKDLLESNKNISFHPYGLGKEKGTFKFTLADRDDSCTFIYSEEEALKKGFSQIDVSVVSLNDFIEESKCVIPDIVKIDTEGLDLDVLEGASNCFGKTEIFMVEAAIGCKAIENTAKKVIDYMDSHGYTLFDITDLNRPFDIKVLWLVELVFVLKEGFLDNVEIKKE